MPDEVYRINQAKTEFRDAHNEGDVGRILSLFDAKMIEMPHGHLSGFGAAGLARMKERLAKLFAEYQVTLVPIIINIVVNGSFAYDFGWHEWKLTPKSAGEPILQRHRYIEHWKKNGADEWKISLLVTNEDERDAFGGAQASWFTSEQPAKSQPVLNRRDS